MVRLIDVGDVPRRRWQQLCDDDPSVTIGQTPPWLDCILASGRHADASRWYRFDDGVEVVLPMARARGQRGSWPFDWGIGGPVAFGRVSTQHAAAVFSDLRRHTMIRTTVRIGPGASAGWSAAPAGYRRSSSTTYSIDLSAGFDALWRKSFRTRVRTAVRKADRLGVRVDSDTSGRLLPEFDQLYRLSVVRWAAHQHEPPALAHWRANRANPRSKFATVKDHLKERCATWVAYVDDRPAAAAIVVRHHGNVRYWRGAMDIDLAGPTCANTLLHSRIIAAACDGGASTYQMGDSRPGSGLASFKEGFGAVGQPATTWLTERLPLTSIDTATRSAVKRLLRFQDA